MPKTHTLPSGPGVNAQMASASVRRWLRRVAVSVVAVAISAVGASAQSSQAASPEATAKLGWKPAALERVLAYVETLSTDTLIIATKGTVVRSYGDLAKPYLVHSVRKAILSALVGQHLGKGPRQIDLDATLEQLGIDDHPEPLMPLQRQATVLHLIRSVSGINHRAAAEGGLFGEKHRRLGHRPNVPGTIWAYNNWDYNALTTIFERRTGLRIGQAFKIGIAATIGMQDFTPKSVTYIRQRKFSRHRAAMFRMSGRDLARFGQLYLQNGKWRGKQVIPEAWIARVSADYERTGGRGLAYGHGYLWWIPGPRSGFPEGTYWASGFGRQAVFVVPKWRTVIVHQSDTTEFRRRLWRLMRHEGIPTTTALEKLARHCVYPRYARSPYCTKHRFIVRHEFRTLMELIVAARRS